MWLSSFFFFLYGEAKSFACTCIQFVVIPLEAPETLKAPFEKQKTSFSCSFEFLSSSLRSLRSPLEAIAIKKLLPGGSLSARACCLPCLDCTSKPLDQRLQPLRSSSDPSDQNFWPSKRWRSKLDCFTPNIELIDSAGRSSLCV